MRNNSTKKGAPATATPCNSNANQCTSCTCAAQGSIRLDDQSIHALFFGVMAAVFELHNLRVQDETGAEHMNLRDSLDSAMETADTMMGLLVERRAK